MSKKSYKYRSGFGAWINDVRLSATPNDNWPCPTFDDEAERSIITSLDLQGKAGFNICCMFGFFATYAWKPDIPQTVDKERAERVNRVIAAGRERGVRVMLGVGVYSWGFDEIIASDPSIQGDNPHAMCLSSENSFTWMTKVLDFILDNFDFDGFHLEASDQGRCRCERCAKYSDVEYYSIANAKCADYIRKKQPGALLMVSMCGYIPWGTRVTGETDYNAIMELGGHIDYLIDPGHYGGRFFEGDIRERLLKNLKCELGSSGGFWAYSPPRWAPDRWFLVYISRTGEFIKKMYEEGESAIEYYLGRTNNPGVEMNVMCGGKILSDIDRPIYDIIYESVGELYDPQDAVAQKGLADIFVRAEAAYFDNLKPEIIKEDYAGELHLEPLFGTEPGYAMYLVGRTPEGRMDANGRQLYKAALAGICEEVKSLEDRVGENGRLRLKQMAACINNVIKDIDELNSK